jgi:hypothetical protein
MSAPGDPDLLASVPFGGLLSRVLRLLVSADRREEFVGDLVEQANDQLSGSAPSQVGLWLWGQTLHSAPALIVLRVRRLAQRGTIISHSGGSTRPIAAAGAPGFLLGSRIEERSWSVPMVVSVSAHAIGLMVLVALTFGQIQEIEAPWVPVALSRAFAPLAPAAVVGPTAVEVPEPRHHRKPKMLPRTPAPAVEARPPWTETMIPSRWETLDEPPIEDPIERSIVIVLPPPVAEKRCLSCPAPRLPPAFVRLGSQQQMLVKTCVGSKGDVTSVNVVHGLGALADASIVDTVRGWRFSPHSVGDHPVPFCYPTRFVFTMN